jgi:hypothetical protein
LLKGNETKAKRILDPGPIELARDLKLFLAG